MSTTVSDDNTGLFYDVDKDKKLLEFFNRGNKLKTTETTLIVLSVLILAGVIATGIYFYLQEKFIFDTYVRKEGPPGTVSAASTVHLLE